jgi:hypothetical protein
MKQVTSRDTLDSRQIKMQFSVLEMLEPLESSKSREIKTNDVFLMLDIVGSRRLTEDSVCDQMFFSIELC